MNYNIVLLTQTIELIFKSLWKLFLPFSTIHEETENRLGRNF